MMIQDKRIHSIITQMLTVLPALQKSSHRNYSGVCSVKQGTAVITDGLALLMFKNQNIVLPEGKEELILDKDNYPVEGFSFPKYTGCIPDTAPIKIIEGKEKLHFFEALCRIKPTKEKIEPCLSFENNRLVYSNERGDMDHYSNFLHVYPHRAFPFMKAMKNDWELRSYPLTKISLYESGCMIAQFGFSEENCFQLLLVGVQEVTKK